jgi:L-alanine-DL-glutamate epimerase-like enolase superfamily enzyme
MEIDPDVVPWYDDLVTVKPNIVDGHLLLPSGPGWGTEIDEATVHAHPPRRR